MRLVTLLLSAGLLAASTGHADLILGTGKQIVFPDGSMQSSAAAEVPAGHGGTNNSAGGADAFVGGGYGNTANTSRATIGGGFQNQATGGSAFIGGGWYNSAGGYATVGGGGFHNASAQYSTIAGGYQNSASAANAFIGGGYKNQATANAASIVGGRLNDADGINATVAGGYYNFASGDNSFIGGGTDNGASGHNSTVAGGDANFAGGQFGTVGGGGFNAANGLYSTVPGGDGNTAAGDYSFAAGRLASVSAEHDGALLLADSTGATFFSASPNEFAVRATGGTRIVSGVDDLNQPDAGVSLAPNATAWGTISEKAKKENYTDIDSVAVLDTLTKLPIQRWNYIHQDPTVQHIGPYAEDFHAAFGLNGEYNGRITTQDLDGVALAAIQGLNQKLEATLHAQDKTLNEKQARIDALEALLREMDLRLMNLENR